MRILPVAISQAKEQDSVLFVELYKIHLKNGAIYIAACDQEITFNGQKYRPVPIERGTYRSSVDGKLDNVELKIGNVDQEYGLALFNGYDFRGCKVEIIKIMYPESLSDPELFLNVFTGYMDDPFLNGEEFRVSIKAYIPNKQLPNRRYGIYCNAEFGDPEDCGAIKNVKEGTVGAGSTVNIILDPIRTEKNDYWTDGIISIGYESRKIKSYKVGIIELDYPFLIAPLGSYRIEQGCPKIFKVCKDRYSNGKNFSGFPSVPFEM